MVRSVAAEHSAGVWAECPQCHASICHGFQVCQSCGHVLAADEQQLLRSTLRKHVGRFVLLAGALAAALMWAAYSVVA